MKNKRCTIIGSGNVGQQLALTFFKKGLSIHQVYSRKTEKAHSLATRVQARATNDIREISNDADYYFICVPDDEIESVFHAVAVTGKILCHTSGSTPLLSSTANESGVFYPLQSFSQGREPKWEVIPVFIEGGSKSCEAELMALAKLISGKVGILDSETRLVAHLAAVISSNFSNHLLHRASEILHSKGLELDILKPLMQETMDKAFENGPLNSQTGPARRGDEKTLALHLQLLRDHPYLHRIYETITQSIQNTYSE